MLKLMSLGLALALVLVVALPQALPGHLTDVAFAQAEKKPAKKSAKAPKVKGAVYVTGVRCREMCVERGHAARLGKSCDHLCRPGCRKAATGEDFCVQN